MTYGLTNFAALDSDITASSPTARTEPVLEAPNTSGLALHTDEVLRKLGADGKHITACSWHLQPGAVRQLAKSLWELMTTSHKHLTDHTASA
jgi:hypothetical protein